MRNRVKFALGLAGAASLALTLGTAAPASASSGLTFWSGYFTGQSVSYANPGTSCTTLPFAVHSHLNLTDQSIQLYPTADCTGWSLTFPASDIHNYSTDIRSFRAVG